MTSETDNVLPGELLGDDHGMTLGQLCRACGLSADEVIELVEAGVAEPDPQEQRSWRFQSVAVWRVQRAVRFRDDLGVNHAGAALALDLLEELQQLRARLRHQEG